jgi:hypothetical protein
MFTKMIIASAIAIGSVAGMLAVGATEPAFAAAKERSCSGLYQSFQNGQCVNNAYINPDRVPNPCGGGACYRGSHVKHKKHRTQQS